LTLFIGELNVIFSRCHTYLLSGDKYKAKVPIYQN
jgi:hypothetical protein